MASRERASRDSPASLLARMQEMSVQRNDSRLCLVEDFRSMYLEHKFSDFELLSGGVSFPVHRSILSARSQYFKALFSAQTISGKESSCNLLDVPDVEPHTLNRMLLFIYASTLEPDLHFESALKLYCAAHKFEVASLKEECAAILRSQASASNVSKIVSLAYKHEDNQLKAFALDFMLLHLDEVLNSSEWNHFLEVDSALAARTLTLVIRRKLAEERRTNA